MKIVSLVPSERLSYVFFNNITMKDDAVSLKDSAGCSRLIYEFITKAMNRLNILRVTGIFFKLLSQPGDMHVDPSA